MTVALARQVVERGGGLEWMRELVDLAELERRGWDPETNRFVPAPADPVFGYARCPVRGCENVTEHTATTLCSRCQHRYGRWVRQHEGGGVQGFLAEITQIRSEDPERLCLVCRTPGHERPVHSRQLCDSCHATRTRRGQSIMAYVEGDQRYPRALPRATYGRCRLDCDALARTRDGICAEHWRHWRRVGAPRGAAFDRWASQVERPFPVSRFVDLNGLPERVRLEVLVALTVSIERPRRSLISDLRQAVNLLRATAVGSIVELDATTIANTAVRLFIGFAQDRLRIASADPEREFEQNVWDLRVFGTKQAYHADFTKISQPRSSEGGRVKPAILAARERPRKHVHRVDHGHHAVRMDDDDLLSRPLLRQRSKPGTSPRCWAGLVAFRPATD